jgi:DNA-3-methyladenine glycosylase II
MTMSFFIYILLVMLKKKPIFWSKAKKFLREKDKKLGKIIDLYNEDFLFSKSDPFLTLARSIVGQQISVKAAQSVWDKLEIKVNKINPEVIKKTHSSTLKSAGLSYQKVSYLKNLAHSFIYDELKVNNWKDMSDEEIINDLTKIKGVGRWTAEMFLIFNLCRADIFPLDDIGMIKGICKLYNISYPVNKNKIIQIGNHWKPYRSVATCYLWRSLDPIPVEY